VKLESSEPVAGEPEDGWVEAPVTLLDTELLQTVLCRFTGHPAGFLGCLAREQRRHPDVDCQAVYFQSYALLEGRLAVETFPAVAEEVRSPWLQGEPIGTEHS
jgi:hypothetical protein